MYQGEDKHVEYMFSLVGWLAKHEVYTTYDRQTEKIWEQQNSGGQKEVYPFGLLFLGCQQWSDGAHTLIPHVPSHVTVTQLSNLGHAVACCRNQSLFRGKQCVSVCTEWDFAQKDTMLMMHSRTTQAVSGFALAQMCSG